MNATLYKRSFDCLCLCTSSFMCNPPKRWVPPVGSCFCQENVQYPLGARNLDMFYQSLRVYNTPDTHLNPKALPFARTGRKSRHHSRIDDRNNPPGDGCLSSPALQCTPAQIQVTNVVHTLLCITYGILGLLSEFECADLENFKTRSRRSQMCPVFDDSSTIIGFCCQHGVVASKCFDT